MPVNYPRLLQLVKILVTGLLLGWLGQMLYQSDVLQLLARIDPWLVFAACLMHLVAYLFLFIRWRNILAIYYCLPYMKLVDSYYIGLFSNNFIPSTVGGDVVRVSYLYRQGLKLRQLLVCAVTDRLLGLAATVLIGVDSLLLFPMPNLAIDVDPNVFLLVLLVVMAMLGGVFLLMKIETGRFGWSEKSSALVTSVSNRLDLLIKSIHGQGRRLLLGLGLSIAGTSSVILCYYLLAQALMFPIPLAALFVVVPLSYFAAALPISVGGLGVREGSIVFLLTLFDVPIEQGLALTAAYLVVLLLVTAPGGVWILGKGRPPLVDDAS